MDLQQFSAAAESKDLSDRHATEGTGKSGGIGCFVWSSRTEHHASVWTTGFRCPRSQLTPEEIVCFARVTMKRRDLRKFPTSPRAEHNWMADAFVACRQGTLRCGKESVTHTIPRQYHTIHLAFEECQVSSVLIDNTWNVVRSEVSTCNLRIGLSPSADLMLSLKSKLLSFEVNVKGDCFWHCFSTSAKAIIPSYRTYYHSPLKCWISALGKSMGMLQCTCIICQTSFIHPATRAISYYFWRLLFIYYSWFLLFQNQKHEHVLWQQRSTAKRERQLLSDPQRTRADLNLLSLFTKAFAPLYEYVLTCPTNKTKML